MAALLRTFHTDLAPNAVFTYNDYMYTCFNGDVVTDDPGAAEWLSKNPNFVEVKAATGKG